MGDPEAAADDEALEAVLCFATALLPALVPARRLSRTVALHLAFALECFALASFIDLTICSQRRLRLEVGVVAVTMPPLSN